MTPRSTTIRDRHRTRLARTRAACHLCGAAIDYSLPSNDPMSFVADHVNPLARGGADTRGNVAAAHRKCNALKGAKVIAPIVRRSGSLD